MRYGLVCVVLGAGLLGACSFKPDYDGTVYTCGLDESCPDGYACIEQRCLPTGPEPATCAVAVGAGTAHACAIRTDGTAWCWGRNQFGQLGDSSADDQTQPVQVIAAMALKLPRFVDVVGGDQHTCALGADHSVWCWGHNDQGQLGNGSSSDNRTAVQVTGLSNATAIAAGANHTCALVEGGGVTCWGDNDSGQLGTTSATSNLPIAVPGLTGVTALAAGSNSTCVVAGGGVTCWGGNGSGQLGTGKTIPRSPPTAMALPAYEIATKVAVGVGFTCVVAGGKVYCTGSNSENQLALPTATMGSATPVVIPLSFQAETIMAGDRFACATDTDHGMWCWGGNEDYELADNQGLNHAIPVRTSYPDALDMAGGVGFLCARSSDGLRCSGFGSHGQLGDGHRITQVVPTAVAGLAGVASMTAGHAHTCVTLADDAKSARCWGDNSSGQLGDGTTTDRVHPVAVSAGVDVAKIVAGDAHTCALFVDGTVNCWGTNPTGQLGDGTLAARGLPRPVLAGDDMAGTPQPGNLAHVVDLATGAGHTCAVIDDGSIRCWGANFNAQLGDGAKGGAATAPVGVKTAAAGMGRAIAVVAGSNHTCALDDQHLVWCWGNDDAGQLGHDVPLDTSLRSKYATVPVQVDTLTGVDAISAGRDFTCAHATDGSVRCWGDNEDGQLGSGTTAMSSLKPVLIGMFAQVAAGDAHACAANAEGQVTCWGTSDVGQVGNGYDSVSAPAQLAGLTGVRALAGGGKHTCALLADATMKCWGMDRSGQLGDGQREATTPVAPLLVCPQ